MAPTIRLVSISSKRNFKLSHISCSRLQNKEASVLFIIDQGEQNIQYGTRKQDRKNPGDNCLNVDELP